MWAWKGAPKVLEPGVVPAQGSDNRQGVHSEKPFGFKTGASEETLPQGKLEERLNLAKASPTNVFLQLCIE